MCDHFIPKSLELLCCCNSHYKPFLLVLETGCRDLLPFSHKSINEVAHWCWGDKWLAHSQRFDSSHKFSVKLRSELYAGNTKQGKNHFRMDVALCTGGIVLRQERTFPELMPQSWKRGTRYCLKCHCLLRNKVAEQKCNKAWRTGRAILMHYKFYLFWIIMILSPLCSPPHSGKFNRYLRSFFKFVTIFTWT